MEEINYAIISIDDSRQEKKSHIRNVLFFYDEVKDIEYIRGADLEQVKRFREQNPQMMGSSLYTPRLGEIGVWLSQYNCWKWAAENKRHLMVFEDDAILEPNFEKNWMTLLEELPADYDFLAIFVPNNQLGDYNAIIKYDEEGVPTVWNQTSPEWSSFNFGAKNLAKAYQGYGAVATMFSPKGAQKLIDIAHERGIYTPVDCFFFLNAHSGRLDGYAPKPDSMFPRLVSVDWNAPTTIHDTDRPDMSEIMGVK